MSVVYTGPECDLVPNADDIGGFLRFWFARCNHGVIELGWLDPGGRGLIHFCQFGLSPAGMAEAVACAVQENLVPGQSVYVRASTVRERGGFGGGRGFTSDADFVQSPGLWGDLDTPEQVAFAASVVSIVRPNCRVITGTVPHLRAQNFFRCSEPIVDAAHVRSLNTGLLRLFGGDSSVVNPTRLMRLPGTIAWPHKAGRVPELTSLAMPTDGRPSSYPLSTLASQLPTDNEAAAGAGGGWEAAGGGGGGGELATLSRVSEYVRVIRAGQGGWHNAMIRVVAHWVGRGWSSGEILLACEAFTLPGWSRDDTLREVGIAIHGAREKWGRPEPVESAEDWAAGESVGEGGVSLPATPFMAGDITGLPPREWVYGHFIIKRFVSVLGAPGGAGKTAYAMGIALAVALGRDLLGEPVRRAGPVWVFNLEDPRDELMRRFAAAIKHHGIDPVDLEGKLYVDSGREQPLIVAQADGKGGVVRMPVVKALVAELLRRGITLLVVDPFVKSHRLEENRNEHIDFAATLWAEVAEKAGCAVLLLHHFRKGGISGAAESFRGASALIDAARAAVTLGTMTDEEAKNLGIDGVEQRRLIRADNAKLNLAPPPDRTTWLRLVSIDLENGSALGGIPSDSVQAIERWELPSLRNDLPLATCVAVLEQLEAGPGGGEKYSLSRRGKTTRWAGQVLVDMSGTMGDAVPDAKAQSILSEWKTSGLIFEVKYQSPSGQREASGLLVDRDKLSEMRQQVWAAREV